MPRYRITTIPSQLLFLEFPITVERMFGRHTIGFAGAYRPALIESGNISGRGAYHLQNYWNFAYETATLGLIHKYYLRDRFGLHLETGAYYRLWWFDRKQIAYSGDAEPFNSLRSERQDVMLLKLLIGKSMMWHRRDGATSHVMEFFAGPSIRWKRLDLTTHITEQHLTIDLQEKEEYWLIGLQVGVRYGIGVGR